MKFIKKKVIRIYKLHRIIKKKKYFPLKNQKIFPHIKHIIFNNKNLNKKIKNFNKTRAEISKT